MEREPTFIPKEDKFQNTIAFLRNALAEEAHLKIPLFKRGGISEDQWVRQKNILGIYFGSPAVLEDIGRMYGVTRERTRQLRDKWMQNLWKNCSSETQALFPFEELALDKPKNQKSRERVSETLGGISIFIRNQMALGKSVEQIREYGLSMRQITQSRYVLHQWGTEVPPYINTPPSKNLELEKNLKNAKEDKEKQELLNQVKLSFHKKQIQGTDPFLVSVSNIFKEAGFTQDFHLQNFTFLLTSLKNAGFPVGELQRNAKKAGKRIILRYYFILAKDKERAQKLLLADPNLQRFRQS